MAGRGPFWVSLLYYCQAMESCPKQELLFQEQGLISRDQPLPGLGRLKTSKLQSTPSGEASPHEF